ncbi:MAG: superoxide dismutase [Chthoniobacteraceae bacterium]|nr:superoxide dismutase [Chthoniobacteraceae bacterium]
MIPLPYGYEALEPYIDTETMHLHYDKHYAAYTKNLNGALEKFPELQAKTIEQLLGNIAVLPEPIRETVRNNGGGYYNHGLFWRIMGPQGGSPEGALAAAILETFGGVAELKKALLGAAASVFGSGWAWLVVKNGKLEITTTPNQDSPLMGDLAKKAGEPILGIDVWEHAYYLKYKNERAKYLDSWWNTVNWKTVGNLYRAFPSKT